ncbi:hypothetical protein CK203_097553 [Vitis vinifera]|uniref:UBN2_3 domain-containing protein n=1 Tax=Vitis vinifera TaxID=29760 RepID=A0A438E7G6_VITVI|nr:hypothetical protein CK203_097553 [Vitis vinifera]
MLPPQECICDHGSNGQPNNTSWKLSSFFIKLVLFSAMSPGVQRHRVNLVGKWPIPMRDHQETTLTQRGRTSPLLRAKGYPTMSTFPPTSASNSNTTTNNSQNPAPQMTQMTFPSPSLSQPLSMKLDETNLLLWNNQLINVIIANGLEDFINPDQSNPPKYLDAARRQVNPKFVQWERLNRLVMG